MFELLPGYDTAPMTEMAMRLPMYTHGSAYALDWNDDGVLDLWHHNHYIFDNATSRWSDPSTTLRAPRKFPGGCMVDWDAAIRDGETGKYYAANEGGGFIDWTDKEIGVRCFDVHSTSFLDIDGDGVKDLFLVTGGGRGSGASFEYDHMLFWGEVDASSSLGYRLVGGRDAAKVAGLNGRTKEGNERGRHQYWLDVDGDGLIDVLTLNAERSDHIVIPGKYYRNLGGRKFKEMGGSRVNFAEFAKMALLTDVDGDGFAREVVVPSVCELRENGSGPPQNYVCKRSPRGSLSVYRGNSKGRLVRETKSPPSIKKSMPYSLATGDFDFDGVADIAILWSKKVYFHLSSNKKKKCERTATPERRQKCLLNVGSPNDTIDLAKVCGPQGAAGFRFADFNLDGRIDMLLICRDPGYHRIYELVALRTWRPMKKQDGTGIMDFGALNSLDTMLGNHDFCNGVPIAENFSKKQDKCQHYFTFRQCRHLRYDNQFPICNLYKQAEDGKIATSVRAFGPTVADLDNDGYPDIILGYRFGSMVMVRNTLGDMSKNKFLAVRLDKRAGPAASIGAIVKLSAAQMGPYGNETITQMRVLSSIGHEADYDGAADDRLVFGLGDEGEVRNLIVHWPHCCKPTRFNRKRIRRWINSMDKPFEVSAPKTCDKTCFDATLGGTLETPTPAPVATEPPTPSPTTGDTQPPTPFPTMIPTDSPTPEDTPEPTPISTEAATASPTPGITPEPIPTPTESPTPGDSPETPPISIEAATASPTPGDAPDPPPILTETTTASPTPGDTPAPTTSLPSQIPSQVPSQTPSENLSESPSTTPSQYPS